MFGNGGLALPVCSFLLLHLPVLPLNNNWHVKDRSGGRGEQRDTHPQPHSTGGQNVKQTNDKCQYLLCLQGFSDHLHMLTELEEVFQWWGEWSSWSSCSRSCGGGVRSQERHCLIQRLSTTQNVNSSYCVGSPKQYQLCPNQPCPSPSVSFKQHQCSQFNSKAFGRRYFQWIPLYPADYISISNKPCDLQCTTIGGERQLLVPAHDGTFCRDTKYHGVCIEGICQPVGCDGQLYSSKTVDRCGVCGGNGTSCHRVSGTYRKALTQLGYVFIANIPAGASDIQIIERHKTENILALSDEAGHFFFNGHSVFDNPQNFRVAGTVFKYRRPSNVFSDGLEYIIAQGPTHQGLNVMYYNLNGKLPHITYEFTIPSRDVTAEHITTGPAYSTLNLTHNVVNEGVRGDRFQTSNQSRGSASSFHHYNTQLGADDRSDVHLQEEEEDGEEELVWEIRTPSPPPPAAMLVYRPADVTSHVINHNDVEELGPPAPSGYRGSSNSIDEPSTADDNTLLLSFPGSHSVPAASLPEDAPYLFLEELHYNQTQINTHSLTQSNTHSINYTNTDAHVETPSSTDKEIHTKIHTESDTHLDAHPAVVVRLQQVSAVQAAGTESNDFDVGLDPDVSLADMYRWKVSAYAPCSSTCTTGISTSYALCVRYDGSEVDDSYCDSLARPEPTHEFCTGKECPPRWETSGWSECSRTCGEGVQYRTVRCWKMLSPGLDSSVYDSLCLSHDLHKPANRKVCVGQSCGPQWEVSEWSECSARCGSRGVRTREVRCSMEMRLCNKSSQPIESQECEGPPCDRRWTVTDWGPCSGVCGEGRMVRAVMCRSSGGVVMSEEQCDQSLRPLAIHPCGDPDCAPHWVEQEWQQCSKTCGSGVQVREVKCYQGEELVTRGHSCDSALKPEARQSCEIQSCPTEPPAAAMPAAAVAVDDSCQDKPTANCALVLKVKLCSHWYYRKACCQSCKAPRP
ncbi:ADAMTS-like protein 2 isoform X5 [Cheilinus undulatus]|uniref:ADAMTS-like protein 2 isoform X5 n=1 Tax=Cheilinus undulatus TaxID=241271 RepID=UPI001BD64FB9|nr:ADAMTS-like protein 2 isoform X5 [Cheilinus undulatus]